MTRPLIRPYSASYAPAIVRVIVDYRAEENGRVADSDAIAAALASFDSSTQDRILVAELAGKLVGYAAFHFVAFPMIQGLEVYVSDLLVAADARGTGVGSLLLQSVEAEARVRGCVRLMLNNHKTDASYVRGFYRNHEFSERDDFANFVKRVR